MAMVPNQERKRKTVNLTLPLTPLPQYTWDNGLVRNGSRHVTAEPDGGSMLASVWAEFLETWESSSPTHRSPDTPLPSSAIIIGEDGVERLLRSPRTPSASALLPLNSVHQLKPPRLSVDGIGGVSYYCGYPYDDAPLSSDKTLLDSPITAICLTTPQASKLQAGMSSAGGSEGILAAKGHGATRMPQSSDVVKVSPLRPHLSSADIVFTSSPLLSASGQDDRSRDQPDVPIDCV